MSVDETLLSNLTYKKTREKTNTQLQLIFLQLIVNRSNDRRIIYKIYNQEKGGTKKDNLRLMVSTQPTDYVLTVRL